MGQVDKGVFVCRGEQSSVLIGSVSLLILGTMRFLPFSCVR